MTGRSFLAEGRPALVVGPGGDRRGTMPRRHGWAAPSEVGMATRVLAAGAVVRDAAGRFLLVQRANDPEAGRWTLPGGRVEPGESPAAAAAREVAEETGLEVAVGREWLVLERPAGPGVVFEIHDFLAEPVGGTLRAGDDAADAGWFTPAELGRMALTTGLLGHLETAGLVNRPDTARGRPSPDGERAP
ncbi:NUDIX domain-containing protein [Actinomycetospora endophytica]|uniref:NUDIX domain-containing protein n=1 Tax=Actinomycetospora endophytica TaxID=2291215 RepID=A0ABS8P2D3_9PSEU|nr:NUDIX domain-containing protein [Actinomycetospora endophytica]MCD2192396.1 NUDIX domain-containing protein [Actinomycetospora endophytica]